MTYHTHYMSTDTPDGVCASESRMFYEQQMTSYIRHMCTAYVRHALSVVQCEYSDKKT